ncbi:hypothetical protein BD779DRAFT_1671004 [Infundibulicybe gibba]|nr:hypothetical protein BD779DRAFT_1671004 [Infundibulicybe gibba]
MTLELTLQRYFLASNLISAVGYGIQATLYITCTIYLWRKRKARRIYAFLLVYMTLLFTLSSVMLIAQAHRVELTFVENQNFPGGPWEYQKQTAGGTLNLLGLAAELALLFLSELFTIWRCWVVWCSVGRRTAYLIVIFPLLMLLSALVTGAIFLASIVHPTSQLALLGGAYNAAWGLAYYTLIIGTNIVLTVLILTRLIAHRRRIPKSLSRTGAGAYTSLITMMIESSAAYSVIGAACLVTYGVNSPVYSPFVSACITAQVCSISFHLLGWEAYDVKQISGYLVIARLAHGQAWQTDTATHDKAERSDVLPSASDGYINSSKVALYIKPERVLEYA